MMIFYHYTNTVGLLGILRSKELWATDCRFLNDTTEFETGKNYILDALRIQRPSLDARWPGSWELIRQVAEGRVLAYVASLSENGDLLSQWRGYNAGRGYSVGFNADVLGQNALAQGFRPNPAVYSEHRDVAYRQVQMLIEQLSCCSPSDIECTISEWWKLRALFVALAIKDAAFSEEIERRLTLITEQNPPNIAFRQTANGLKPYVPCNFHHIDPTLYTNGVVEEIIVGPALPQSQVDAVEQLVQSLGLTTRVRKSTIPYVAD